MTTEHPALDDMKLDRGIVERHLVATMQMLRDHAHTTSRGIESDQRHHAIAEELRAAIDACPDAPHLYLKGVQRALEHFRLNWLLTDDGHRKAHGVFHSLRGLLFVVRAHQGDPVTGASTEPGEPAWE